MPSRWWSGTWACRTCPALPSPALDPAVTKTAGVLGKFRRILWISSSLSGYDVMNLILSFKKAHLLLREKIWNNRMYLCKYSIFCLFLISSFSCTSWWRDWTSSTPPPAHEPSLVSATPARRTRCLCQQRLRVYIVKKSTWDARDRRRGFPPQNGYQAWQLKQLCPQASGPREAPVEPFQ